MTAARRRANGLGARRSHICTEASERADRNVGEMGDGAREVIRVAVACGGG